MGQSSKPTIYSIARALGVAPSTVSRALNPASRHRVGEETARRVLAKAAEVGYEPNRAAVSLRTSRTATIGLVVPRLTDQVVAVMSEAAEDTARRAGYQLITTSTRDRPEREGEIVAFLRARDVDGFILATATLDDHVVRGLAAADTPFILLNRKVEGHPAVAGDDELGGYLATRHLIARGHRRIGYIAGPLSTSTAADRGRGYRRAHREAGLDVDERLIVESTYRAEGGTAAAAHLLSSPEPPSAIFAVTDATAIGAMAVARDVGLKVPDDIAVIGYNDSDIASLLTVPLSSVRLPLAEMGRRAVELLLQWIDSGHPPASEVMAPQLMVRASSAVDVRGPSQPS